MPFIPTTCYYIINVSVSFHASLAPSANFRDWMNVFLSWNLHTGKPHAFVLVTSSLAPMTRFDVTLSPRSALLSKKRFDFIVTATDGIREQLLVLTTPKSWLNLIARLTLLITILCVTHWWAFYSASTQGRSTVA